jgi:multidrug efflux pump
VSLTDVSVRNPVFAWMLMAATMLFGIVAITRIGISQYPDVDYPNISVSVNWPGASPPAIEREICDPVEQALSQVEGVQQIQSQARSGSCRITVTFDISRNVDLALQDVQSKVSQAQRSLPKDVQAPTVSKSNPDDTPVLTIGISGAFSRQVLADYAKYQVQAQLQTVEGVGQIQINGGLDRNVRIWLDAHLMQEKGVVATDIISAIAKEHVEVPGGQLTTGERTLDVRLLGEAIDLEAFKGIIIRKTQPVVRLGDVGIIEDGFADVTSIARLDGAPLQALGVLKQRGTNAVSVATAVRNKVAEIEKTLPKGMKIDVLFDSSVFIEEAVHEIELELVLAIVLTAFVCWLFLGSLSSTANVILAIPMSLLGTVAVVYFCGFTLNTFTLLGLSLAVGLVVDDAVMVMENLYRHSEMGKDRVTASLDGTKEITFAALAATLAVVAIFLPVIFMKGVIGKFFFQFGVTLSVAVLLSYLEAITLAPARCAQMLNTSREGRSLVGRAADAAFSALERFYSRTLAGALRFPKLVLLGALLVLIACGMLVTRVPSEFVPAQDQSRLMVRLQTEAGTTPEAAAPLIARAEARIAAHPEVEHILSTLQGSSGSITLNLVPPGQRKITAQALLITLRKELQGIPGLRASLQDPSLSGFGISKGNPVDFTVRGSDWDIVTAAATKMQSDLEAAGVVADMKSDYVVGSPELEITPDRQAAADLGVSVADLGNTVAALIGGNTVGKFSTGGRRIDIRMRLISSQRNRPEDIALIGMRTSSGKLVPMSMLVTQKEEPVLSSITRLDRERAIGLSGNVAPGHSQAEVMAKVNELAAKLPTGCRVVAAGQASQLAETTSGMWFALAIGIMVAYMVLASQFNSFLHPATVLTILPFAVAGAVLGLLVSGKSLNLFSMIGLLLLMGIVKKNSILLVEYANHVVEHDKLGALEAMQKAGPLRLRPILMTTIATMMAAVPPVLGIGPGTETRSPMAAAVLGGLTVSTVLSLLVVPAFYVVADRMKASIWGLFTKKHAPPAPPASMPPAPPVGEPGT